MQCFNHNDIPAVAICLSCGKALCKSCCIDVADYIVCSDICKSRVIKQMSIKEKGPRNYLFLSKLMIFCGILFAIVGIYHLSIFDKYFLRSGIFMCVMAILSFVFARYLKKSYKNFVDDKKS
jgi:hypothetical protein